MFNTIFTDINKLNEVMSSLSEDKVVVYTYGAWDLFHPGHVRFLTRARELGDFLIVGTVSDQPIRDLKGQDRPIQSQKDRMIVVGSLGCVDASILQKEYDPSSELKSLSRVDILTKGDDWEYIPGKETIEELGGSLIKLRYTQEFSTSSTLSRIRKNKLQ